MTEYYYHDVNFYGDRSVYWMEKLKDADLHIYSNKPLNRGLFLSESERVVVRRQGMLKGEYLYIPQANLLVARSGKSIKVCIDYHNMMSLPIGDRVKDWDFQEFILNIISAWDAFPLIEGSGLIGDVNYNNYGHFTVDVLNRVRLLNNMDVSVYVVPDGMWSKSYQKDLFSRCTTRKILPVSNVVRLKDPHIARESLSTEFLMWIRDVTRLSIPNFGKRFYIRRELAVQRKGSGISDTPEFQALLSKYGFQSIDFADGAETMEGELSIADGAGVILAAHGTNLTNIIYMNGDLNVFEVARPGYFSPDFFAYSHRLGFKHNVLVFDGYDADGDVIVDCNLLEQAFLQSGLTSGSL